MTLTLLRLSVVAILSDDLELILLGLLVIFLVVFRHP